MLDLLTADYSFVNERLAKHYGIPNVTGNEFQRVHAAGVPPRPARPGQHPDADVGRRPHLAGAARQVGHGSAARRRRRRRRRRTCRLLDDTKAVDRRQEPVDARAHGRAPQEPGVHLVPPGHRSARPGARELRRDRRVAHQGQRSAGRLGRRSLRRHQDGRPGGPARGAAEALRTCSSRASPRT